MEAQYEHEAGSELARGPGAAARRRTLLAGAALVLAGIVCACFFLPWVRIESTAGTAVRRWLGGAGEANLLVLSGYQIPRAAGGRGTRTVLEAAGLPWAQAQARSVWALPALAIALAGASLAARRSRRGALGVAIAGGGTFLGLLLKILTAPLELVGASVHFEPALWITVASFLAFGAIGVALSRQDGGNVPSAPP